MTWRGYEFYCLDCGKGYLREANAPAPCPNPNCKGNYMQLYAMVETSENKPFGMLAFFTSRRILDKS